MLHVNAFDFRLNVAGKVQVDDPRGIGLEGEREELKEDGEAFGERPVIGGRHVDFVWCL